MLLGQAEPVVEDPVENPVEEPVEPAVELTAEGTPTGPTVEVPDSPPESPPEPSAEDIAFAREHIAFIRQADTPLMKELLDNSVVRKLILGGSISPPTDDTVYLGTAIQPTVEKPQTLELPEEYRDDPFVKALVARDTAQSAQIQEILGFVNQQKEAAALQQVEQDTLRRNTLLLGDRGSTSPYEDAKYLLSPDGMEEAVKIIVAMRNAQRTGAVATPPVNTTLDQRLALANKPNGAPTLGAAASTTTPKVEDEGPPDGFIYETAP